VIGLGLAAHAVRGTKALVDAGIVTPRVDRMAVKALALRTYGAVPAAGLVAAARSYPDRPYVIDEERTLTFDAVDRRTNAIARGMHAAGVREGHAVGILCRNGHAFVEAVHACSKLGATILFLNTDFAGPQLAGVLEREGAWALISDAEFDALLEPEVLKGRRWVGHREPGEPSDTPALESLVRRHAGAPVDAPRGPGRLVILTSGTTGVPKGASRTGAPLPAVVGILDRLPYRAGQVHHVVAPLFHGWGLLNFTLGLALPTTIVLRRRFDPEETLRVMADHRVAAAPMVPTMLQRIMELPAETLAAYDLSHLRAIPLSGSAIPGDLAVRAMDALGDVVFNFYGSTETGWASIATPEDLRAAPGTAGRPPLGTDVVLLDDRDRPVARGETGRIFVASQLRMDGYTDPSLAKAVVDGRMSTGDVGHFDADGRLFVDGRDDDMIVSGGENVFPREVEDLLASRSDVAEVAVVGVDDERFGKRLRAYVVPARDAALDADAVRRHVRANLARYRCRATSCSSTRCRATRPARSSGASFPDDGARVRRADAGRARRAPARPAARRGARGLRRARVARGEGHRRLRGGRAEPALLLRPLRRAGGALPGGDRPDRRAGRGRRPRSGGGAGAGRRCARARRAARARRVLHGGPADRAGRARRVVRHAGAARAPRGPPAVVRRPRRGPHGLAPPAARRPPLAGAQRARAHRRGRRGAGGGGQRRAARDGRRARRARGAPVRRGRRRRVTLGAIRRSPGRRRARPAARRCLPTPR
jgi:fatty-acyl-CoA synthase